MKVKFSALRELQTFKSIESLNLSMRAFLYRHKHDLSENAIRIYHLLTQHSVKIPGVSFASIKYLCYKAEVSRSTVFRALKKLEELGAIRRHAQYREDGGRAQSVYIILPQDVSILSNVTRGDETGDVTRGDKRQKPRSEADKPASKRTDTMPSNYAIYDVEKQNNVSSNEIDLANLDHTYTPKNVPSDFVRAVKPFYSTANQIYKLWGSVLAAANKVGVIIELVPIELVIEAFKESVFALKARRIKKDFGAYFYGTVYEMLDGAERKRRGERSTWGHDWVNAG